MATKFAVLVFLLVGFSTKQGESSFIHGSKCGQDSRLVDPGRNTLCHFEYVPSISLKLWKCSGSMDAWTAILSPFYKVCTAFRASPSHTAVLVKPNKRVEALIQMYVGVMLRATLQHWFNPNKRVEALIQMHKPGSVEATRLLGTIVIVIGVELTNTVAELTFAALHMLRGNSGISGVESSSSFSCCLHVHVSVDTATITRPSSFTNTPTPMPAWRVTQATSTHQCLHLMDSTVNSHTHLGRLTNKSTARITLPHHTPSRQAQTRKTQTTADRAAVHMPNC